MKKYVFFSLIKLILDTCPTSNSTFGENLTTDISMSITTPTNYNTTTNPITTMDASSESI